MKDIEVMRSAIIEAVNKNDVSKRDLGNVTTINKIIEGLEVKFDAIKLAYSRLSMAREKRKERDPAKVKYGKAKVKQYNKVEQNEKTKVEDEKIKYKWEEKKVEQKVKQNIDEKVKQYNKVEQNEKQSNADNSEVKQESKTIQQSHDSLKVEQYKERIMSEIEDLKSTVNELRAEIESLKATVSNLSSNKPKKSIIKEQKSVANIVMGFSIRIENTWTQGNRYEKYYAVKRIAGKLHRIYIGKDSSEAEEKIKAYCEKKGISMSMA